MVLAIVSIFLVGFYVWAHHMYVAGITEESRLYFTTATMIIAIPTAVKIFTWTSNLSKSVIVTDEVVVVVIFIVCFTLGGYTGVLLSNASLDIVYHDTYYVVGHFHYVLSIASIISGILVLKVYQLVVQCVVVVASVSLSRSLTSVVHYVLNSVHCYQHHLHLLSLVERSLCPQFNILVH